MGLDYAESDEPTPKKPECDKCHTELKANNMFSCQDDNTVCGECWKKYLEVVRAFFT